MPTQDAVLSVNDQIAAQLRAEVLGGVYKAGEPLREVILAERFGVSRSPIRQVLQQFVLEGLLQARRNCGVVVAPPPPPDAMRELFMPLRAQVETYALGLCYDDLREGDFNAWARLLSRLRLACEERDYPAMIERDFDFHRAILVRASLQNAVPVWTILTTQTRIRCENTNMGFEDPLGIYELHARLLEVFRAGDKQAALEALSQHITDGPFNVEFRKRWHAETRRRKARSK